jgi:outer membrane lipoprotein SlyB
MAEQEITLTPKTYIFAAVGAVVLGGIGGAALGSGEIGYISSAIIGAIVGAGIGLYL